MTYQQALAFLYEQLPAFSRIGAAAYKANLDNIIALCRELDHPEKKFKSIHVAGTNGKGSVSHMLAAIFQAARYKTGLYTSPHISDFSERIKINGIQIAPEEVVRFVENNKQLIDQIKPSFFEMTVAMAFDYFSKQEVDIAIVEVGLGGLLDSTNIITPELSIITNISLDHTNLLGTTIQEIAVQKAGIIKKEVPVILGDSNPLTAFVFEESAAKHNSELLFADQIYWVESERQVKDNLSCIIRSKLSDLFLPIELDLKGRYQLDNVCTVYTAVKHLIKKGWNLEDVHLVHALANVKSLTGLRGRFDILRESPAIIADVAHNEAGIRTVIEQVNNLPKSALRIVLAFVEDKELSKVMTCLPGDACYYFTQAQIPRALPSQRLWEMGKQSGLKGTFFPDVKAALEKVMQEAGSDDLILITGSFFIMDEVYRYFEI